MMNRQTNPVAQRALRDAAALVQVAAPADWPNGFVVVNERLPPAIGACAIGDGVGLAAALGHRSGVQAVLVDVARYIPGPANATAWELATLEAIIIHEAAHALLAGDASPQHAASLLEGAGDAVPAYSPERVADMHHHRWAAAYWVIATRGAAYRRAWGGRILDYVRADLKRYGFPPDDVARVTRGVDRGASLRRLLQRGGPAEALLANVLPETNTRAAAIVAAGLARAPQPTGAA